MSKHADLNFSWAWAIFEGLHTAGVTQVVISPGSRSTPLALAASRHPNLKTRVVLDERTAAFMALGAARVAQVPVALLATSGTAVTEWLPAVTEADLSRVPLILLSADRPAELRYRGANQTIEQTGLFDTRVRSFIELPLPDEALFNAACQYSAQAAASARWPLPGPAHVNVPLREPLTPEAFPKPGELNIPRISRPTLQADQAHLEAVAHEISARPGLIICGPQAGGYLPAHEITSLAAKLGAPVLADPLSNLRCGQHDKDHVVTRYDACLRQAGFRRAAEPAWVLRFGAMPVSKVLGEYLAGLTASRHLLVDSGGRWPDPLHATTDLIQADPASVARGLAASVSPAPASYLELWREREAAVEAVLSRPGNPVPDESVLVGELAQRLPEGCLLFTGNSLPVRQLDWFLAGRDESLEIVCNRGASGIDGNIATLLGMALASERPVVGLLGDLALMHDIGSLQETAGLRAVIVVLDNGGGAIFDHLPQSSLEEHEALFVTPREVDLQAMTRAFGVGYRQVGVAGFDEALDAMLQGEGVGLLHVRLDRRHSLQAHRALWAALTVE